MAEPPAALDPRRVARWGHAARLAVATAIFVAAVWAWDEAPPADTRVAALAFALTAVATAAAVWRAALRPGRVPSTAAAAGLAAFDLGLATAAVHVTGGGASQFAALYVLAIAGAALALPFAGAVLTAALGCALYAADVLWWRPAPGAFVGLLLQLGTFGLVAVAAGWLGARLRAAGAGGEALARALARARVEAADVLRNMTSGVVTVDAAGRLLYANAAAEALLGVPLRARLGGPALDEVAAAAPGVAAALGRAARDGERTSRAEAGVARPGGAGTLGVTTTLGGGAGEGRTATAIFTDITASKQLEGLRLRAERLEGVAELAASLAHEIRNPLASIRSAVEQLARLTAAAERAALGGDAADDARALAGLTVRESDRLSRLLGEFLDFARARVTRVARVDVAAVAREAARAAAAHPDAAGVRVTVAAGADAPAVDGDAELLHRAVFNLVLNAAQASAAGGGGEVRVAVRRAGADEVPAGVPAGVAAGAGGAVVVQVADDGAGVAAEVAGRLFDPFVTTRAGGSGLGLAVVQRAVAAHGGAVVVDGGGGGGGATFTCVLPGGRG
jgi:two-component system sensor histidine kinase PilS (NtrC family)